MPPSHVGDSPTALKAGDRITSCFSLLQPQGTILRCVLSWCFSNVRGHENHPKCREKHRSLSFVPRNSDSVIWGGSYGSVLLMSSCMVWRLLSQRSPLHVIPRRVPAHSRWAPAAQKKQLLLTSPFLISFPPILSLWDPGTTSQISDRCHCYTHTRLPEHPDLRQGQYWLLSGFRTQPSTWCSCHLLSHSNPFSTQWPVGSF